MFHSAGYFRAIPCPFFERGLCQRAHCHYRHANPDTKAVERKASHSVKTGSSRTVNANKRIGEKASTARDANSSSCNATSASSGLSHSDRQKQVDYGAVPSKAQRAASSHNMQSDSESNRVSFAPTSNPSTSIETEVGDEMTSPDEQSIDQTMLEIFGSSGEEDEGKVEMEDGEEDNGEDSVQNEEQAHSNFDLAKIESDFIKATADGLGIINHTLKEPPVPLPGLKRKRVAHLNAPLLRNTKAVRINSKTTVSSGFAAAIDPLVLQTQSHKKRVVRTEESSSLKRPILPLTINARVPTKVRQKFLDAFIDEFLNAGRPAQEAYSMGLEREKQNFDRSSSHMAYLNSGANQLRRLRAEVKLGARGQGSDEAVDDGAGEEETKDPGSARRKEMDVGRRGRKEGAAPTREPQRTRKSLGSQEGARVRTAQESSREGGEVQKKASLGTTRMQGVESSRKKISPETASQKEGPKGVSTELVGKRASHVSGKDAHSRASREKTSQLLDRPVKKPKLDTESMPLSSSVRSASPTEDSLVADSAHYFTGPNNAPTSKPTATISPGPKPTATISRTSKPAVMVSPAPKHAATISPAPKRAATTSPTSKPAVAASPAPKPAASASPAPKPAATVSHVPRPAATISANQFYSKSNADRHTATTPAREEVKERNNVRHHSHSSSDSSSGKRSSDDPSGKSVHLSWSQQQVSMAAEMAELFGTSDSEQEEVWEQPEGSFETALTSVDLTSKRSRQAGGKAPFRGKRCEEQSCSVTPLASPTMTPEPDSQDGDQELAAVRPAATIPQPMAPSKATAPQPGGLAPPPGELINLTAMASRYKSVSEIDSRPVKKGKKRTIAPAKPLPPPTYTILKKKTEFVLTGPIFYDYMKAYLLNEEQLVANGYPRATAHEGTASMRREIDASSTIQPVGPNAMRHSCTRCGKPFIIYNSGGYQSVEECSYHFGRLRKSKEYGEGVVSVFSCCQGRRDSLGCQVAKMHVTAGEQPSLESGYVQALPAPAEPGYTPAVYSVDCEMCYTTKGLQLTRVTVIDMELHSVYEALVKPSSPIVDYNTLFSGLTSESLASVETRLEDVQQQLRGFIYEDTILVGHSLESDLKAMKFIHSTVVDTALVFPHPRGLPYKRALKSLIAEHLKRFIQDNIDGGHDSQEDAGACMELMLWKVKADMLKSARR